MATPHLPNYLRAHRKRLALSQEEIGYLLGSKNGPKVCRYERFVAEPSLATALAYEAIYGKPLSEIFAGLYEDIKEGVVERANTLAIRISRGTPSRQSARKCEALADIAPRQLKKHSDMP